MNDLWGEIETLSIKNPQASKTLIYDKSRAVSEKIVTLLQHPVVG